MQQDSGSAESPSTFRQAYVWIDLGQRRVEFRSAVVIVLCKAKSIARGGFHHDGTMVGLVSLLDLDDLMHGNGEREGPRERIEHFESIFCHDHPERLVFDPEVDGGEQ